MSAMGQKQTCAVQRLMSAFGPIADITLSQRRYLTFSQTRIPTPSRPSTGLLLGSVLMVRVSPSNLKNLT